MKKKLVLMLALCLVLSTEGCSKSTGTIESTNTQSESTDEAVDAKVDYQAFVGSYQDSFSERASANITENPDKESVHIEIVWGNSADSYNLWTMDATFDGVNKLEYTNGEEYVITNTDGNESSEGVFIEMSGYFEWDGSTGNLSWTGSEEESCRDCVFERVE